MFVSRLMHSVRGGWEKCGTVSARDAVADDSSQVKIAFVYAGGRLGCDEQRPADFFYGARELASRPGWEIEQLETDSYPTDLATGFLFGFFLRRYLPPRTSAEWIARTRRVLPRLRGCDVVVAASTELSFGLALWKAVGRLPEPLIGILCGFVNFPIGSELRRRFTASLLSRMRPVLFANSEKMELCRRFGLSENNITVGFFGVDETFWRPPHQTCVRSGVLAVGNDGRRDYSVLIEAARVLPEYSFTIITRMPAPNELPANVGWHRGDWRENVLSDEELRNLYQRAACVVVPLRESIQPSGQSVAMQAMMCGAKVVHTHTSGWWGGEVIRESEEVILVPPGEPSSLARAIRQAACANTSENARKALLSARWTSSGFADRIAALAESCLACARPKEERTG